MGLLRKWPGPKHRVRLNQVSALEGVRFNQVSLYHIRCPGCGEVYVGKTNCCLGKRLEEHGTRPDQSMYKHLDSCEDFRYLVGLYNLPDIDKESTSVDITSHFYEAVKENSKTLITSDDWLSLAYLEPLMAKRHNASINHGDKAMRTLNLF